MPNWFPVAGVIGLTVYIQLIVKWQVSNADALPASTPDRVAWAVRLLVSPWVISAFAAAACAACLWFVALTRYEPSHVYPFMSATFAIVLVLSAVLFDESISVAKVTCLALIAAGLAVGTRA
jgi:uncharacterized membrane protein